MKNTLLFLLLIFIISGSVSFSSEAGKNEAAQQADSLSYKIFKTKKCGWGYNIYSWDAMVITQPIIPATKGDKCFARKRDAEKTARLVIQKIKQGVWPPSIAAEELDSMNIKR